MKELMVVESNCKEFVNSNIKNTYEVKELLGVTNPNDLLGKVKVFDYNNKIIANMYVTTNINGKETSSYEAVMRSLFELKSYVTENDIKKIVFKDVGSNLRKDIVECMINYVFEKTDIKLSLK